MDSLQIKTKKSQISRCKGFHLKYNDLCKARNCQPALDIRVKNKNYNILDFYADRIKLEDWLNIVMALGNDTTLHYIAVKLRRSQANVVDSFDTEKKIRTTKPAIPMIVTKFVMSQFIDAIAVSLEHNTNINTLILEGLPLMHKYITTIAKGLSKNISVKNLSFAKSCIGDEGCKIICSTITHLRNIESVNLSGCCITTDGAEAIMNLIKYQKISRYTEGWEKSLRYRDVDPDTIAGLKRITLNHNPEIKDEGLNTILELMKEDLWIKAIDMQNCGITDIGAQAIVACLETNKTILLFDIKENNDISEHFHKHIDMVLRGDSEDEIESGLRKTTSLKYRYDELKNTVEFLEKQLSTEIFRRQNTESLNEKLHKQLMNFENDVLSRNAEAIPDGFTLIEKDKLMNLLKKTSQERMKRSKFSNYKKRYLKKTKSETVARNHDMEHKINKFSKSDIGIPMPNDDNSINTNNKTYFEMEVGDSVRNSKPQNRTITTGDFVGIDVLKAYIQKKKPKSAAPNSVIFN